jgi:hypothetical protein
VSKEIELLTEIRDLLLLIAEPELAKRDQRLRAALQQVIGKSKPRAKAVILMDGTRSQADVRKESGIDPGELSRLLKALREAKLIGLEDEKLKLAFPMPSNLIDSAKDK